MQVEPADVLLTVAEVAAAFVGFASIVAIFQRRGAETSFDVFRFWILLEFGLASLFFALLPFVLHFLRLPEEGVWAISSAVMPVFVLGHMLVVGDMRRRGVRAVVDSLTPALSVSGLVVQNAIALLGVANAVWLRDFGFYFAGLALVLLSAAVNFVRLVHVGMPALRP